MKQTIYRHGDVVLHRIVAQDVTGEIPRDPDGAVVLARGEATGHRHFIRERDVALFDLGGDPTVRVCRVGGGGATLRHEEHGDLVLSPGDYRVTIKRQYEPEGRWSPVQD